MKKTYITPETKAYIIATQHQLLAGSTTEVGISSEVYDKGSMTDLSRSFDGDFFDDEE